MNGANPKISRLARFTSLGPARWLAVALAAGAGAAVVPFGCSSSSAPTTPVLDSGTPNDAGGDDASSDAPADVASETGADAADDADAQAADGDAGETGAALSARAQKGLTISPFTLDATGLSLADQEKLGVGSYLVNAAGGCNDCHAHNQAAGPPKFLGGGTAFDLGGGNAVYARNLTSDATTGLKLTEAEFVEALQTGKDFRNSTTSASQALIVMPWQTYRWMSTTDLKAIYAYLKKVPADANAVTADAKGALASIQPTPVSTTFVYGDVARSIPAEDPAADPLWSTRGLSVQPVADPSGLATLSAADKSLYGRGAYLVNAVAGCNDCHTNPDRSQTTGKITTSAWLTGGRVFAVPPGLNAIVGYSLSMGANLLGTTKGAISADYADFHLAFVEGKEAIGTTTTTRNVSWPMPFTSFKNMVEEDVKSIHTYLANQARIAGAADKATQGPARYCTSNGNCLGGETCNVATNECVDGACTSDADCGACQTCTASKCKAPVAGSACLASGI
jgi:hypothetical protein